MRFITFLLAVVACAGVVYNQLQLRDIRQELNRLQARMTQQKPTEPAGALEAKQHLQRALQLISAGKLKEAQAELEQGSKAIAESSSKDEHTQPTLEQLQRMMDSARKELARFWSGKQETKP